jgi:primosomal protein N'
MFVIKVIPLIRGTKIDTLSYFSSVKYTIGTFVSVPIRGKKYFAIIIEADPVSNSKSTLKSSTFTLRKLPEQPDPRTVPSCVLSTAEHLIKTYPCSVGAILYQLLPPDVRNGQYQYPTVSSFTHQEDTAPQIITAIIEERYVSYRSHIRTTLARRGSILFVVPTSTDLDYAFKHLSQGIEDRVVLFSPYQTKKAKQAAYASYEDTSLAKLIITTPTYAYLDRVDLLSIIVENSASDLYKNRTRPYLDHRTALTTQARIAGRSILLGDILPRTEDEHYRRTEIYTTYNEETRRIAFPTPLTIIEQKDKPTPDIPFSLFSPKLLSRVKNTLDGKGRVFLFGARRGISPVIACVDCGHIFRCPDSHTPYSLMRTTSKNGEEERWFVSSTSGKRVRAADTCGKCGSWRLKERGIGIQHVYDECKNNFPDQPVLLFDHLTASTKNRAKKIIEEFYSHKNAILVGTQMALPYLNMKGVDLSAIISLDATRANPTWRADENTFRLLLQLREISSKEVLVQTRSTPDELLKLATQGSLENFYTEEISLRETLNYPCFSTFILLSWTGDKVTVDTIEESVKLATTIYTGNFYNNPTSTRSKILRHALFRLPPKDKKLPEFINILRALPPYIRIEVDPNRIV